jgi:hypothetical protein
VQCRRFGRDARRGLDGLGRTRDKPAMIRRRPVLCRLLVAALGSCRGGPAPVPPHPAAVEIRHDDPPPGAKNLGPIESISGHGCGLYGSKGSYEAALAGLRDQAQGRGGDVVRITKAIEPHVEGGCYDVRFVIRGVVFRVAPPPETPAPPPAIATNSEDCVPLCSPGYVCQSKACRAQCDPPCGAGQACGQDRTCRSLVFFAR